MLAVIFTKESLLNKKSNVLQVKATDLYKWDHVINQLWKQSQLVVLGTTFCSLQLRNQQLIMLSSEKNENHLQAHRYLDFNL